MPLSIIFLRYRGHFFAKTLPNVVCRRETGHKRGQLFQVFEATGREGRQKPPLCIILKEKTRRSGAAPAAVGAVGTAAGAGLAPAAVPKEFDNGQKNGDGDESDEKDIEPHIRPPPGIHRRGAPAGPPARRGRTARGPPRRPTFPPAPGGWRLRRLRRGCIRGRRPGGIRRRGA